MATLTSPQAITTAAAGRLIERFMSLADVTERHDRFATFSEPGLVKIVWTLEADSLGPALARFRTETRVLATDAELRRSR